MSSLVITHINTKGKPIGTLDDKTKVEVVGALAGEEVLVDVGTKKKRGVAKGFLLQVIKPSPERVEARCPHVPQCGGCTWQQMDYAAQLKTKEEMVRTSFGSLLEGATFLPIIGCSDPWRYRNKMEYSFSQTSAGKRYLGLILAGGGGRVLNLEECHLTSQWSVGVLKSVREWWLATDLAAYHHFRDTGALRTLTVREALQGRGKLVMLTVSGNPEYALKKEEIQKFSESVIAATPAEELADLSIFVRVQQIMKGQPTQFYEMHLHGPDHIVETLYVDIGSEVRTLQFKVSPSSFFQPNTKQAGVLYSRALQMVQNLKGSTVFDLYCGTATIGLALATVAKEVIGIELNRHAILDAEVNKELNSVTNLTLYHGDVGKVLEEIPQRPDLVIVDPPRAGLDERALKNLIALGAPEILYLSCYPPSQAANIVELAKAGYRLVQIQPVDQFPHTMHVENIAYLVKN